MGGNQPFCTDIAQLSRVSRLNVGPLLLTCVTRSWFHNVHVYIRVRLLLGINNQEMQRKTKFTTIKIIGKMNPQG